MGTDNVDLSDAAVLEALSKAGTTGPSDFEKASDPKETPFRLTYLVATHPDWLVRGAAAENRSTPPHALHLAACDADAHVRACAASNPNTPPRDLELLARDENDTVRARVAANPNTPTVVLADLANDRVRRVWEAARKNPAAGGPYKGVPVSGFRFLPSGEPQTPRYLRSDDPEVPLRYGRNVFEALACAQGPWLVRVVDCGNSRQDDEAGYRLTEALFIFDAEPRDVSYLLHSFALEVAEEWAAKYTSKLVFHSVLSLQREWLEGKKSRRWMADICRLAKEEVRREGRSTNLDIVLAAVSENPVEAAYDVINNIALAASGYVDYPEPGSNKNWEYREAVAVLNKHLEKYLGV